MDTRDNPAEKISNERVNVFEDITMADDGHQLIASTTGDLIFARHVTMGSGSIQWLGQISDASIQQLSKDNSRERSVDSEQPVVEGGTYFENRHGTGRQLT